MVALGSDHGGFELKEMVKAYLDSEDILYKDYGCESKERCDYPVYGKAAAEAVASGACDMGIVICTTGAGISIVANKVKGIRCAQCADPLAAEMARKHNNANMLALDAGMVGPKMAEKIVETALCTEFEGGRHSRRVDMIAEMEK